VADERFPGVSVAGVRPRYQRRLVGLVRGIRFRPRARISHGRFGQAHLFYYTPRLLEWFP